MYRFLLANKEWLSSIAVIAAGIWLLFKWLFGEFLRQKKESPSLDGKLSVTAMIPCEDGRLLVTVEALWNNHSPLSIYLNLDKCYIAVFRLDSTKAKKDGVFEFPCDDEPSSEVNIGELVCEPHRFLKDKDLKEYYRFEPKTKSTIVNHFVLQPGIYGIRMVLFGKKSQFKREAPFEGFETWWKELLTVVAVPTLSRETRQQGSHHRGDTHPHHRV